MLELLIVLSIIAIALVALLPAVTSLSKAGGRRAARDSLLGGIEQARAEAIKGGSSWVDKCGNTRGATYVVFATFATGAPATLDRYNYRSYAIFQDTPNRDNDPAHCYDVKQLSPWKSLPTGVALRAAGTAALSNLPVWAPPSAFTFTPDPSATPTLLSFQFNSNGEVTAPATDVLLAVFEGYVNNGAEIATGRKDANGNPYATEYLMVSKVTGRAEPVPSPTATP